MEDHIHQSKISIIVAMAKNRVIGTENRLPWNIPDELKRFKEITLGHPIIMGRKTHQSIGRVLPGRENLIVTRDQDFKVDGGIVVHSLKEAIEKAQTEPGSDEIFIIGGGEIYKQALPLTDKLYLTIIDKEFEGDTYFPDYSEFKKVLKEEKRETDGFQYTLLELEKL